MNVKKVLPAVGLSAAMFVSTVAAYDSENHIYEAKVVSANPVYRTVTVNNPKQQCWEEAVHVPAKNYDSKTPEILGAIVGAGVGRLFGSGRGQDVATVAGAVLGGSIGRDQKNKHRRHSGEVRYEQRCKVVDEFRSEERFEGYDVTYEYNGILYKTQTQHDPGETIKVSVNVTPVE